MATTLEVRKTHGSVSGWSYRDVGVPVDGIGLGVDVAAAGRGSFGVTGTVANAGVSQRELAAQNMRRAIRPVSRPIGGFTRTSNHRAVAMSQAEPTPMPRAMTLESLNPDFTVPRTQSAAIVSTTRRVLPSADTFTKALMPRSAGLTKQTKTFDEVDRRRPEVDAVPSADVRPALTSWVPRATEGPARASLRDTRQGGGGDKLDKDLRHGPGSAPVSSRVPVAGKTPAVVVGVGDVGAHLGTGATTTAPTDLRGVTSTVKPEDERVVAARRATGKGAVGPTHKVALAREAHGVSQGSELADDDKVRLRAQNVSALNSNSVLKSKPSGPSAVRGGGARLRASATPSLTVSRDAIVPTGDTAIDVDDDIEEAEARDYQNKRRLAARQRVQVPKRGAVDAQNPLGESMVSAAQQSTRASDAGRVTRAQLQRRAGLVSQEDMENTADAYDTGSAGARSQKPRGVLPGNQSATVSDAIRAPSTGQTKGMMPVHSARAALTNGLAMKLAPKR
jgi:hypothetical protein